MFGWIDGLLSRITMYRLVLYYLIALLAIALLFSVLGWLPFSPMGLMLSTAVLVAICLAVNTLFAQVVDVQTNTESVYITACILALIITPSTPELLLSKLPFFFWVAVWAMASKYILAIKNKHIFNPAAFAVALTALTINQSASWWVGTSSMLLFVLAGGFLVVRKVQRLTMISYFLLSALLVSVLFSFGQSMPVTILYQAMVVSPLFFFAAVMLTEPLTTPPTKYGQIAYGCIVGVLFSPQFHIGGFYLTPELALLAGNIFTYAISPKGKYVMELVDKIEEGEGVRDFVFVSDRKVVFQPGQYLEWTLGHKHVDDRGNRRYFTIASSPTERMVILGVKFYANPSSFKSALSAMRPGDTIIASQLAGEFTLPKDPTKKLVFIAGGIGITPFRSMLKYLIDRKEKRSIVTLYSCNAAEEVAYASILNQAEKQLGCKTIITLTDQSRIKPEWRGQRGYVTAEMIAKEIPDYRERIFYISGPHVMVEAAKKALEKINVPHKQIKTDFFPGLA